MPAMDNSPYPETDLPYGGDTERVRCGFRAGSTARNGLCTRRGGSVTARTLRVGCPRWVQNWVRTLLGPCCALILDRVPSYRRPSCWCAECLLRGCFDAWPHSLLERPVPVDDQLYAEEVEKHRGARLFSKTFWAPRKQAERLLDVQS